MIFLDNQLLGDLFFSPAQPLAGADLDDETLLQFACEEFPEKEFCIVRRWMLIDVILSDDEDRQVRSSGLRPTVIYAQAVTTKAGTKAEAAHGKLSGFQLRFEGCFFETQDMLYILAGRGSRKFASKPTVFALADLCGSGLWNTYENRPVNNPA
ncbi:hypothetical protein BBI10_02065 [Pseudomonas graminis]|uniref:DUF6957 domain-containing protein n=1 Tax=Pseudomonas graminis TaxID=158627 RepID=A0A1C2EEZ7_9PSED|nr:hypothetical protein [Pseudomonas graminis]OCX25497.1 hypothetical protein BBI10_02065 [Pseudomonas graminis]